MVYVLIPFCLIAAAAIGIPAAATMRGYRALPIEVPDHFDGYGWPDATGPRPVIFAMTAAQLIAATVWALFVHAWLGSNGRVGGLAASGFAADGLLVCLAVMQGQIRSVALGESARIAQPFRPLLIVALGIVLAVLSAAWLR